MRELATNPAFAAQLPTADKIDEMSNLLKNELVQHTSGVAIVNNEA